MVCFWRLQGIDWVGTVEREGIVVGSAGVESVVYIYKSCALRLSVVIYCYTIT